MNELKNEEQELQNKIDMFNKKVDECFIDYTKNNPGMVLEDFVSESGISRKQLMRLNLKFNPNKINGFLRHDTNKGPCECGATH